MMKIVLGALALTGATTPALATETSWSTTDRDLASLSSSLTQGASGVSVSGFLRSSYVGWSDQDVGGFSIDDAQIWVNGTVGDFGVVVQTEAADSPRFFNNDTGDFTSGPDVDDDGDGVPDDVDTLNRPNQPGTVGSLGNLGVLDAYVTWNATEMIKVQMGQFRPAVLGSSLGNENNLLFINRSGLGARFAYRDQGVQVGGSFGMVNAVVYLQNGDDLDGDEISFGGRASATIMGTASANEGALGASGDPSLTVGLGFTDDKGLLADQVIAVDAAFTMGALGVSVEIVDVDEDDATLFNVAGSFVVMPDQLEVGLRYEDFDDADNENWITLGANWYLQGHAAKWQFNYIMLNSDDPADDTDLFQVGLTVSM